MIEHLVDYWLAMSCRLAEALEREQEKAVVRRPPLGMDRHHRCVFFSPQLLVMY
jgi:hypothetical protein